MASSNISYWQDLWDSGNTPWNSGKPSPYLVKFYDQLLSERDPANTRILVPLCGKAADLFWLYENGLIVVGIEAIREPILEFFRENEMEFKIESDGGVDTYTMQVFIILVKSLDNRLTIVHNDFFRVTPTQLGGPVDLVLDRGAIVAVEFEDRKRYAKKMHQILCCTPAHSFSYLLMPLQYDLSKFQGPPRALFTQDVQDLFVWGKINLLGVFDESEFTKQRFGLDSCDRYVYLITST